MYWGPRAHGRTATAADVTARVAGALARRALARPLSQRALARRLSQRAHARLLSQQPAFTFTPENFRAPQLPHGLSVLDVPCVEATHHSRNVETRSNAARRVPGPGRATEYRVSWAARGGGATTMQARATLNAHPITTLNRMVEADVLVMATRLVLS